VHAFVASIFDTPQADLALGKTACDLSNVVLQAANHHVIEMALEQNYLVGNCDNGYSCVYWNTVSWRTPTMSSTHPKLVMLCSRSRQR